MKINQPFLLSFFLALIAGCGGGGGSTNPGQPETVSILFSTAAPTVVAAKIGSGPFMIQSLTSGKLSLSIPAGTTDFAVAYLCTASSFPAFERVFEATTADGNSFTLPCVTPSAPDSTGNLTGNVDATGIPEANLLDISASNGSQSLVTGITADTNFGVTVPAGTDRIEVLAYNSASQALLAPVTLVAARNFDNQAVPGSLNGGTQIVLGGGDRTTLESISYSNVPAGYTASTTVQLIMAGKAGGFTVSRSTSQYPVLPAGAIKSGDAYTFFANAMSTAKPTEMMFTAKSSATAGPVSFAFPASWSYSGPAPAAFPDFNFDYAGFGSDTSITRAAVISWGGLSLSTQISLNASARYQSGSTTLAIPDLSALPGFVAAPASGTLVVWVALIEQNNPGIEGLTPASPTITSVENSGSYRVP